MSLLLQMAISIGVALVAFAVLYLIGVPDYYRGLGVGLSVGAAWMVMGEPR